MASNIWQVVSDPLESLKMNELMSMNVSYLFGQAPPGTARRKRRAEQRRQFADSASARPSPRGFGSKN